MSYNWHFWVGFHIIIFFLIFLDLCVFRKGKDKGTMKTALYWTLFWVAIALGFNTFIYFSKGYEDALLFFTGYLVEKSLSVDNIFVFIMIFSSLHIQRHYQHKILYLGLIGALVFRLSMILFGVSLLEHFAWMYYVFGGFLCFTAVKFLLDSSQEKNIDKNLFYKILKQYLPVKKEITQEVFVQKIKGRLYVSVSFLALVMIEVSDFIFALDSIPAILAITTNTFIVYTSNVFAILGLRSLYLVLDHCKDRFHYFSYGLSAILCFVGLKMLIVEWIKIPNLLSLGVIFFILLLTVLISLLADKGKN
jgi:tellurite resistance protein TerC